VRSAKRKSYRRRKPRSYRRRKPRSYRRRKPRSYRRRTQRRIKIGGATDTSILQKGDSGTLDYQDKFNEQIKKIIKERYKIDLEPKLLVEKDNEFYKKIPNLRATAPDFIKYIYERIFRILTFKSELGTKPIGTYIITKPYDEPRVADELLAEAVQATILAAHQGLPEEEQERRDKERKRRKREKMGAYRGKPSSDVGEYNIHINCGHPKLRNPNKTVPNLFEKIVFQINTEQNKITFVPSNEVIDMSPVANSLERGAHGTHPGVTLELANKLSAPNKGLTPVPRPRPDTASTSL
jgi:hypothetical protein